MAEPNVSPVNFERRFPGRRRRSARYWLRLLILLLLALSIPLLALPLLGGALPMWKLLHPGCARTGTPADYNLPFKEITIPVRDTSNFGNVKVWHGFWIPGTRDATIIAPAAYNGDRGSILYEAALLAQAGYNVLTVESVICAGRAMHSLGYLEVPQIADVLAYLKQNNDGISVNMAHIALHGFSSAGAPSLMATARYPEIAAVLAEGNYYQMTVYLNLDRANNLLDRLVLIGATVTYRLVTGQDPTTLSPIEAIQKIPPRPVFLVYGSLEAVRGGAQKELDAARSVDPNTFAELWIVPGSEHGGYTSVVGNDEYTRRVVPFYDCALFKQCDVWNTQWTKTK